MKTQDLTKWNGVAETDFSTVEKLCLCRVEMSEGVCVVVDAGQPFDMYSLYAFTRGTIAPDVIADFKPDALEKDIVAYCRSVAFRNGIPFLYDR
jgi:hypothetical protein